ncbi:MAG TPA: hypothetical protein VLV45_01720 [Gemmatimonadales bacterium]|nr:hypothetical protein [Gemmatimonadales bacterium]
MSLLDTEISGTSVCRAAVVTVHANDVIVALDERPAQLIHCTQLETVQGPPPQLETGDAVLVWRTGPEADEGVVLGRVGKRAARAPAPDQPEELVLEAKRALTLRVGDGSITIREDGKILIRGKDLVSHATRTNRIKGGSVQIN